MAQIKLNVWIMAARPKTLGAAIAPVIIGMALAYSAGGINVPASLAAVFCAVMLQVGANYSNDYFDYIKGVDTAERTGPLRATQAGLVAPSDMKRAFVIVFSASAIAGIYLVYRGGLPILIVGILSIISAILYTGGPYPLGYNGLGDIFVLIFFGFTAVGGTYYVNTHNIDYHVLIAGAAPGFFSMAILTVNNIRDIDTDRKSGKKTLAVRFGRRFSSIEYLVSIIIPCVIPALLFLITGGHPYSMASSLVILPAVPLIKKIFRDEPGPGFNKILGDTGKLIIIYSLLFSIGWII